MLICSWLGFACVPIPSENCSPPLADWPRLMSISEPAARDPGFRFTTISGAGLAAGELAAVATLALAATVVAAEVVPVVEEAGEFAVEPSLSAPVLPDSEG